MASLRRWCSGDGRSRAKAIESAQHLKPSAFDPKLLDYLVQAESASIHGYTVAFLAMAGIALLGALAVAWLVRKPQPLADPA